ncbi:MAG TPA: HlyD family efflux transporter periplasmic adaptor subunit [Armatimonadota bacterium]|nr:HlyD family efflux transporter periplasmic adaptor subunit [Armatimonadota bacterium]HOJ20882.1 HlyD family efflux transporter periplasmic adaptor subunit [Armatimonadota bacterium]HOM83578.1 HlyD family efflux transporter periplasmic adaptor subunit [Armatimonadota bacterium]HPO73733.1 HlyD family efflux transporter periplasmic adaptor subunit [Armatimonadota bacterium]HPT98082.1 HlyD family efflux transporter periplasmic adaptor subunit [Armatimonadota bacterium]
MSLTHSRVRVAVPVLAIAIVAGLLVYRAGMSRRAAETPEGVIIASGTVEMTQVAVSSKLSGRLERLLADEGDVVKCGQPLARLDARELEAKQAELEAAVAAAEARLQELEKGARPEELARARAALARAEAAHSGALDAARTAREGHETSTELKRQVDTAEANLRAARAQEQQARARLSLLRAGPRPEELDQARAALASAKARLALARKGPREEEIQEAEAGLAQAEAVLENAEATLKRTQKLFQEGAVARQQLDDALTARDRARAAVDAARARARALHAGTRPEEKEQAEAEVRRLEAQVALLEAGTREEEIAAAEAELRRAQANVEGCETALANARRLYRERLQARGQRETAEAQVRVTAHQVEEARAQLELLRAGATPEAVQAARAARDQAKAALDQLRARLDDARIMAPIDGVVAEQIAEEGEVISAGQSILTLVNPRDTWVKVYLPVTLLGQIGVGTPARVRVDAFPGEEFPGRVVELSQIPEFTPKNVQTQEQRTQLVFWVKVAVENSSGKLKPGLPADALFDGQGAGNGR